jgi:hypothetical protein
MHKQLASYLGVAANNISVWLWGNPVRLSGLLPNRHVKKICDLYGIKARWLEVESIEEFKVLLDFDTPTRLDLTIIAGRRVPIATCNQKRSGPQSRPVFGPH